MSTLKVNTIEGLTSNVTITAQSISTATQQSNVAVALAIALGV